jgi:DNA mismatch repair protein MutS2
VGEDAVPRREPRVGDRVRVRGVGAVGELVELADGAAEVRCGAMMVKVPASDLDVIDVASARDKRPRRTTGASRATEAAAGAAWIEGAMRTPGNTLDLRGLRVEEGLERLGAFLDEAMLAGRDTVFVLHGHGTGAMKSAIRRALAESRYVSESLPAPEDQGGDALTVSRLRG